MTGRTVFAVSGPDRVSFLQGLVTNDVEKSNNALVYAALLTPQGKYIADFFLLGQEDRILIDVATSHAPILLQRLTMYRLRAAVEIETTELQVSRGLGNPPQDSHPDPRHSDLGWRRYGTDTINEDIDWDAIRVTHVVPETGIELTTDSYILEARFEALNGVDFKKGCFVGQEIVARMKHKTDLRKGLAQVSIQGTAEAGMAITSSGKPVGMLHTISDGRAIAYLRFDRADGILQAGEATLTRKK